MIRQIQRKSIWLCSHLHNLHKTHIHTHTHTHTLTRSGMVSTEQERGSIELSLSDSLSVSGAHSNTLWWEIARKTSSCDCHMILTCLLDSKEDARSLTVVTKVSLLIQAQLRNTSCKILQTATKILQATTIILVDTLYNYYAIIIIILT